MKKAIFIIFIIVLASLSHIPGFTQENYLLGPDDELEIRVWGHDDLTRKVRVGLDGKISFPFVGEVNVKGRTVPQVQKEMQERLAQGFIVNPIVSITVTEFKSQKFFVVGNVSKPGSYPLTHKMNVIEAISQAGGLLYDPYSKAAVGSIAVIVRAKPGEAEKPRLPTQQNQADTITISLTAALTGDPSQNLEIKPGDTVYVPSLSFYVAGQVKNPGRYPYDKDMTVLMAVTTAGGFTDKAAPKRTNIVRPQTGGGNQKLRVTLEDRIQPGDTIVVPESWF